MATEVEAHRVASVLTEQDWNAATGLVRRAEFKVVRAIVQQMTGGEAAYWQRVIDELKAP